MEKENASLQRHIASIACKLEDSNKYSASFYIWSAVTSMIQPKVLIKRKLIKNWNK